MIKLTANTDESSGGGGVILTDQNENYDPDVPTGSGTAHNATTDPDSKVPFGPTATNEKIFKGCTVNPGLDRKAY